MITGNQVRLRAIEREDIPRFVRWLNDRDVTCFLLVNSPLSTAMEEKWFDRQLTIPPNEGQVLAIEVLQEGHWIHIGNTGLHNVDPINRSAEFGIFIGEKAYWNKGLGSEAVHLTLKHGFEDLNLNRIYLKVYANNTPAIRSYTKSGFVKEGVLRQGVYKNGSYLDLVLMSVLRSEWDKKQ